MSAREVTDYPRLADADLGIKLPKKAYEKKLKVLQNTLTRIPQAYLFQGHSAAILFEGWDAAGKGGTIRRISAALDPRSFKVWPIGALRSYHLTGISCCGSWSAYHRVAPLLPLIVHGTAVFWLSASNGLHRKNAGGLLITSDKQGGCWNDSTKRQDSRCGLA